MWTLIAILTIIPSLSTFVFGDVRQKEIVITYDDLPGEGPNKFTQSYIQKTLADQLVAYHVPATGFVTGRRIGGSEGIAALKYWAERGLQLGNHTWSHLHYSKVSSKWYISDIQKIDPILSDLNRQYGPWTRSFRFPYLDYGDTQDKEIAANNYLKDNSILLGHVSVDTSDWAFSKYYNQFLRSGKTNKLKPLEGLYLAHILDCLDYAESASKLLFNQVSPQILLLHASPLNAAMGEKIILALKERGYRFVDLRSALEQEPYRSYRHKVVYQGGDHHFFHQVSVAMNKPLIIGRDRTAYKYFQDVWEPKIKSLME